MFTPQDQTMFHSVLDKLHSFGFRFGKKVNSKGSKLIRIAAIAFLVMTVGLSIFLITFFRSSVGKKD